VVLTVGDRKDPSFAALIGRTVGGEEEGSDSDRATAYAAGFAFVARVSNEAGSPR